MSISMVRIPQPHHKRAPRVNSLMVGLSTQIYSWFWWAASPKVLVAHDLCCVCGTSVVLKPLKLYVLLSLLIYFYICIYMCTYKMFSISVMWSHLASVARRINFTSTEREMSWELLQCPCSLKILVFSGCGPEILVFLPHFSPSLSLLTLFLLLNAKCFLNLKLRVTYRFWHLICCC